MADKVVSYTVRKRIKFEGVSYEPGKTIPASDVERMRNVEVLLTSKYLVPAEPEPKAAQAKPAAPAPAAPVKHTVKRAPAKKTTPPKEV